MSKKIILNKQAQYYPRPSYGSIHPVLIIGIAFFVIPFLLPVFGIHANEIVKNIFNVGGIMLILIGGVLSIFNASN
jgi:uncharacterized membrane protein